MYIIYHVYIYDKLSKLNCIKHFTAASTVIYKIDTCHDAHCRHAIIFCTAITLTFDKSWFSDYVARSCIVVAFSEHVYITSRKAVYVEQFTNSKEIDKSSLSSFLFAIKHHYVRY